MGADIGPSRAGFVVVFDRRSDPTALLILFRQFCLTRPPVLELRLNCLVTRAPPSIEVGNVDPVEGVSGDFGDIALGEGMLRFVLRYPRIGLVGLNGMERVVRILDRDYRRT